MNTQTTDNDPVLTKWREHRTWRRGDPIRWTGKTEVQYGATWHEYEVLDGPLKGRLHVTNDGPLAWESIVPPVPIPATISTPSAELISGLSDRSCRDVVLSLIDLVQCPRWSADTVGSIVLMLDDFGIHVPVGRSHATLVDD